MKSKVLIVSPEVLPSSGLVVSAPGLRSESFYKAFCQLGVEVKMVVSSKVHEKKWLQKFGNKYWVDASDHIVLNFRRLNSFIKSHNFTHVLCVGYNQIESLEKCKGVIYIIDMFAPKFLEELCKPDYDVHGKDVQLLYAKKSKALKIADVIIVNGEKKIPYYMGWSLSNGVNITKIPLVNINMFFEHGDKVFASDTEDDLKGCFAIAGVVQPWTDFGEWFYKLYDFLAKRSDLTLNLFLIDNWEKLKTVSSRVSSEVQRLQRLPNVVVFSQLMSYQEYCEFIREQDFIVDVFDKNIEREYAFVTRTSTALSLGVPVIHSSFTEVSSLIAKYNAGWLAGGGDVINILSNYEKSWHDKSIGARSLSENELSVAFNLEKVNELLSLWG